MTFNPDRPYEARHDSRVLSTSPHGNAERVFVRCYECGETWVVARVSGGVVQDETAVCEACGGGRKAKAVEFEDLFEGDRVLFGDRVEPLTVERLDENVNEQVGAIHVLDRMVLRGPRGGEVVLERTSTGRVRAVIGSAPPTNVGDLFRVPPEPEPARGHA